MSMIPMQSYGSMVPMRQSLVVRPRTTRTVVAQRPGPSVSVVTQSKSVGPQGGVGIAFEDRLDQRTGGMLKIVAEVFNEGAAADWNATAPEEEAIHAGDLLVEVNGESVARYDMKRLSQIVPGPVGSPVILRLRSLKSNKEFEVELIRQLPQKRLGPGASGSAPPGSAPPGSRGVSPQPEELNNMDEAVYEKHDAKITTMKAHGQKLACPGFSIEPIKSEAEVIASGQEGFLYMIGNVTKGSQAHEFGFKHGEVIEAIDGLSVRGWQEKKIKSLLMDAAYSVVQIHTDKRIVPVKRDCDAEPTLFPSMRPVPMIYPVRSAAPVQYVQDLPPMPRAGRDPGYMQYYAPMPSANPVNPYANYTSVGQPNLASFQPQAPNQFASQDYGYMAPGNQPQYSTVQTPAW